ncbi:MAG: hypothetical protein CMH77_05610 [Nitrospinae bacterium]|nr:hypothetical protein [Nitrospinota bacterium]
MKSFSRAKAFAFTLTARVLMLLPLLGLAEGAFRIFNPDYDLRGRNERSFFCVFDSVLGWTPKTNFTGIHEKDGFAIPVHQNQFGLRASDSLLRENPEGKYRVIVLGDQSELDFIRNYIMMSLSGVYFLLSHLMAWHNN